MTQIPRPSNIRRVRTERGVVFVDAHECPFCGSREVRSKKTRFRWKPWRVECSGCTTQGPPAYNELFAFNRWNTRGNADALYANAFANMPRQSSADSGMERPMGKSPLLGIPFEYRKRSWF